MADSAFTVQYRQELIDGFEQRQSLLRMAVTTEFVNKGGSAVFCVADSNSAEAVTRGLNGLLPYRAQNLTQSTATLVEWHDPVRMTGFNIFASQGNQIAAMQKNSIGTINRKIDDDIFAQLETGTTTTGATATTMSTSLMLHAKALLGNNEVPFDGNVCAVISPAAEAYLLQAPEFASADYVSARPVATGETAFADVEKFYNWLGLKIIVHPRVPGVGTTAEKLFVFHKNAIGHAADTKGMQVFMNYNEEHDYSFVRSSIYMGSKLLQNSGVVVINHDASEFN